MQDAVENTPARTCRVLAIASIVLFAADVGYAGPSPMPAPSPVPMPHAARETEVHLLVPYESAPLPTTWKLNSGYLFHNDRYIPLGSEIDVKTGVVTLPASSTSMFLPVSGDTDYAKRTAGTLQLPNFSESAQRVCDTLRFNGIAVCQTEALPRTWSLADGGTAILASMLDPSKSDKYLPADLAEEFQQPEWQRWLTSVAASPDLTERAAPHVSQWTATIAANEGQAVARQRLESLWYPLTLLGMVLVVLAFGQLLWFRPGVQMVAAEGHTPLSPETATFRCVILIVMMGLLDLSLTVLAHQANAMMEVNPIGNRVLSSIPALISFKLGLTAFAAGVLYYARREKIAQFAAWWGCLVMCLLTARWVVFNQFGGS